MQEIRERSYTREIKCEGIILLLIKATPQSAPLYAYAPHTRVHHFCMATIKMLGYFLPKPKRDLIALMAFSLINDSSNLFNSGSNSSDVLTLARSGSVLILCSNNNNVRWLSECAKNLNI